MVTGVSDGSPLVDDDQFGPALPIVPFDDVEDALERANGTMFGLGPSVWGTDLDRAEQVAERVEAGTTWVNSHRALAPFQPFSGRKWSGLGSEGGIWGLEDVTDVQLIYRPGFTVAQLDGPVRWVVTG